MELHHRHGGPHVTSSESHEVLVIAEDDADRYTVPIAKRGFDVSHRPTTRASPTTEPSCIVCVQSKNQPVTSIIDAFAGAKSPLVFVYRDDAAAATALDAGADATVPAGETSSAWETHLAATVERLARAEGGRTDPLLSSALDELPDIIFVSTLDGRLLRWNDRLSDRTGFSDDEIAGMQPLELFEMHDLDRIENAIGRTVMGGTGTVIADLRTKDGESVPHEFVGSLITVEGASVIVGTARDVSRRIDRERALAEQAEQLEAAHHVNALIRRVMAGLLSARSRSELIAELCDRLTGPDGYRLAWVGSYDGTAHRVEPDAWAGEGLGYLEERQSVSDDGETVTAMTAIRENTVVFAQDVASAAESTNWRSAALAHGHRAAAAIPLSFENANYGCLCLYAEEPDAFGPLEREVLAEFGGIIGHAIHALETRRALVADTATQLRFMIVDDGALMVRMAEHVEGTLSLVGSISQPDGSIVQLYSVSGIDVGRIAELAAATSVPVDVVVERDDECLVKVSIEQPSMAHVLAEVGGRVGSIEVTDGTARVRADIPRSADTGAILNRIGEMYDIEFIARREVEQEGQSSVDFRAGVEQRLTDRQLDVMKTAFVTGFFDQPREKSGEEIAELLDIAAATFHQHIRIGERKLLEVLFERSVRCDDRDVDRQALEASRTTPTRV